MRSLILKGPGALAVEERPDPVPGPGEAVVVPEAIGICGSDVHGYAGESGRRAAGMTMGHELYGRVVELGARRPGDPSLELGANVVLNPVLGCGACALCAAGEPNLCWQRTVIGVDAPYPGGYSERLLAPVGSLVAIDPAVGTTASLVEPLAVALHAVAQAGVREHDRVAVLGSGMIGLCCAWAALRAGAASVHATDMDPAKTALATELGARGVTVGERPLRAALDDDGIDHVDVVVDAVGLSATCAEGLEVVRAGGTVAIVGMGTPQLTLPAWPLITRERRVIGTFCYSDPHFAEAVRAVERRELVAHTFVDREIGLDAAPAVFAELAAGGPGRIKTLVRPLAEGGS
jgi:threonine dehydrogenase-like Zn-dependent dehydrogenase